MGAALPSSHDDADRSLLPPGAAGGLNSIREAPDGCQTGSPTVFKIRTLGTAVRILTDHTGMGISVKRAFSQGISCRYAVRVSGLERSCDRITAPGRAWPSTTDMMWLTIDCPVPYVGKSQSRGSTAHDSDRMPSDAATSTRAL